MAGSPLKCPCTFCLIMQMTLVFCWWCNSNKGHSRKAGKLPNKYFRRDPRGLDKNKPNLKKTTWWVQIHSLCAYLSVPGVLRCISWSKGWVVNMRLVMSGWVISDSRWNKVSWIYAMWCIGAIVSIRQHWHRRRWSIVQVVDWEWLKMG